MMFIPAVAHSMDPFEIQVYDANITPRMHPGLEIHSNYTFSGREEPAYEGELPPHQVFRMQLEPTFGLTDWLELGAHIYTWVSPDGEADFGGLKLRGLFVIPPELTAHWFFGLKAEVGWVASSVSEHGWGQEFRFILGYADDHLLAAVNPVVGWGLEGSDSFRPDLDPASKVALNTRLGFSFGLEHYASLGAFADGLEPRARQEHLLFAAFDLVDKDGSPPPFDLNVGFGKGLTNATYAQWIAKAVVGFGF